MAVNELSFGKTWESSTDFPTIEPNEAQVRADLQYHPDAIKDYINDTLVPAVNSNQTNVNTLNTTVNTLSNKVSGIQEAVKVTITESDDTYTASMTYAEIAAAIAKGAFVYAEYFYDIYIPFTCTPQKVVFRYSDSVSEITITIASDDTVTYTLNTYPSTERIIVTGTEEAPVLVNTDGTVLSDNLEILYATMTLLLSAGAVLEIVDTILSPSRLMLMTTMWTDDTNEVIYLQNTTISSQWRGLSYTLAISATAITRVVVEMYLGSSGTAEDGNGVSY